MAVKTKSGGVSESKSEIGKKYIDRLKNSRTFEPLDRPQVGESFWIPRQRGEKIRGVIYPAVQNFRRSSSYPIQLEDGRTVEIFGNKVLHTLLRQKDVFGQLIEIEYIGRQFTHGGHYRKIYRLNVITRKEV